MYKWRGDLIKMIYIKLDEEGNKQGIDKTHRRAQLVENFQLMAVYFILFIFKISYP